jgi:predicted RNA polymerase sigma factor
VVEPDGKKRDLIAKPHEFFAIERKNLEERLNEIRLDEESQEGIIRDTTQKAIRDKLLGLFKIGEIAKAFLDWNDAVEQKIRGAKKSFFLKPI